MKKFLNITNHDLTQEQVVALGAAVEVVDCGFPTIDPQYGLEKVYCEMQNFLHEKVLPAINDSDWPVVAHVMGESVATPILVSLLQGRGITCVCSTTSREVVEEKLPDGSIKKISKFVFCKFRKYPAIRLDIVGCLPLVDNFKIWKR